MKKLNLENINSKAPYLVHERENKLNEFYFWSDFLIVSGYPLLCFYILKNISAIKGKR